VSHIKKEISEKAEKEQEQCTRIISILISVIVEVHTIRSKVAEQQDKKINSSSNIWCVRRDSSESRHCI
jgi:hypothetical protein